MSCLSWLTERSFRWTAVVMQYDVQVYTVHHATVAGLTAGDAAVAGAKP
jgi:hypothetical protein